MFVDFRQTELLLQRDNRAAQANIKSLSEAEVYSG